MVRWLQAPWIVAGGLLMAGGCFKSSGPSGRDAGDGYAAVREAMVAHQIEARGVRDRAVLDAMRRAPRHAFVPPEWSAHAYEDGPLPIGNGQTISQPYMVAAMTELLQLRPEDVVLEVGTGSGYQAAVLAEIVRHVYTIEIVGDLAARAKERLARLGYANVTVQTGDGYQGWPEHAPFDGIIVTAGAEKIPEPLIEQLKPGRRIVIPVGENLDVQWLKVATKGTDGSLDADEVMPVRFVPLTGEHSKWR